MITNKVSKKLFLETVRPLHKVWELLRFNVEFPPKMDAEFYLDVHGTKGYGVGTDGELRALWSLERGQGKVLVAEAVSRGATWLTCFDNGYLVDFYIRCGFDEVGREPNWTAGQPDVVRLAWRQ